MKKPTASEQWSINIFLSTNYYYHYSPIIGCCPIGMSTTIECTQLLLMLLLLNFFSFSYSLSWLIALIEVAVSLSSSSVVVLIVADVTKASKPSTIMYNSSTAQ